MRPCTVLFLALLCAGHAAAQETRVPTADQIKELATKYQQERDQAMKTGAAQRFSPQLMEKAEEIAKRGAVALQEGRFFQAAEAFRQARWQLPYQAPQLPDHVSRILGNMRLRHSDTVVALAFSPNGTRLATASSDHSVKLWDVGNGHEILCYTGHSHPVSCLAFSPDGTRVASAAGNLISLNSENEIKIWDVATGKDLTTVSAEGGLATSILYSRDGKYLITGQSSKPGQNQGVLAIYETERGKLKRKITDYRQPVTALAANFDGSILAVGVGDGLVQLWQYPALVDNLNQPAYWSQQDPAGATDALAFSPDNRTLARVGTDGIKLYNLVLPGSAFQAGSPRQTIAASLPSRFHCAVFSKDNKTLFAGGDDGILTMFDMETGQVARKLKGHLGAIKGLALHPNGSQLASASSDNTVRLWDFDIVLQARDFVGHEGAVWTSAFSPDGRRIVSAGADRTIRIWDVATGKTVRALKGHAAAVTVVQFSPDGKTILSGAGDKLIKLWDTETGQPLRTFAGHVATVTTLDFSKDGTKFVSGSADKTVKIWETGSAKPFLSIEDNKSIVGAVAYGPNGKQIAVGNIDQNIRLYDAATGKLQASWPAHGLAVSGLAYSPDGQWLASCGADQLVRVWPLKTPGKNAISLIGHTGPLSAVAFRADNQYLASTGADQTVKLWKIEGGAGKEVQTYRGHKDWVTSASFSKDGYYIVSSGVDRLVKLWEITARELPMLAEHAGKVQVALYSPDGMLIVTGASDKTIKIWDSETGLEQFTLRGHNDQIRSLAITPDSKTLISGGYDRNIRLWDLNKGKALPLVPGQQQAFTGLKMWVNMLAMTPDGKKLLVWVPEGGESFTTITGYDLATGTELFGFRDRGRSISSLAFSNDGKLAATGAKDGSVRVFDLDKNGTMLPGGDWFLYEKGTSLGDLAITPDNTILVAGSNKGDVKICSIANKETLKTIKAHDQEVRACQISFDGKRFVTVSMNNEVKLWDLKSAEELRRWDMRGLGGDDYVQSIAFSPDNKHLVTGNADTTVFLLDLP